MSDEAQDIKKEVRGYLFVFAALGALTIFTVALSYLNVTMALAIALALCVATLKSSLVASFFMHLIHEKKIVYFVLILAVAFFAVMMFFIVISPSDTPAGTRNLEKELAQPVVTSHDAGEHNGGHH